CGDENVENCLKSNENEYDDNWLESDEDKSDLHIGKQFVSWQDVFIFLDNYCK
ncbi:5263_t:CDS:1, partial [Scutellospora calospora]